MCTEIIRALPLNLLGVTPLCWASGHTGHLVLNQPLIPKAAVDTGSLGPWGSLNSPETQLAYVGPVSLLPRG